MIELLEKYSLSDILVFIIMLAIAIKEIITFFDWIKHLAKDKYKNKSKKESEKTHTQETLKWGVGEINTLHEQMANVDGKINLLIDSNKDDIKAFLTKEHHFFCYEQGWIDDFSLDCCEKRFSHYQRMGGNSFIEGFMKELRELPRREADIRKHEVDKK